MRIALTSVLMSALVNASPSSVAASTIIYSNLSPTGTYICCTGWLVGTSITINYSVAMDFTVSDDYTLDTVEVALSEIDPSSVTLNFASDNNGLPGGVIETFVLTGLPPFGSSGSLLMVGASSLHPLLSAGERYWLVASSADLATWNFNSAFDMGLARSEDGNPFVYEDSTAGAYRVLGTPAAALPVPEPMSLLLLGPAIAGVGARRWRQRKIS